MTTANIQFGAGVTIGAGVAAGAGTPPAGAGSITYAEMPGPVVAGYALQDTSATVNDPIGFTINNGATTGVAVQALSSDNINYFNNLGVGNFTATLGAGSTYHTIAVQVVTIPRDGSFAGLVFFFAGNHSYPATFNYPITIA